MGVCFYPLASLPVGFKLTADSSSESVLYDVLHILFVLVVRFVVALDVVLLLLLFNLFLLPNFHVKLDVVAFLDAVVSLLGDYCRVTIV